MLEKYPYNEEFEAWEMKTEILDEEVPVLAQANDEEEFIRRASDLTEKIAWLNGQGEALCDLLSQSDLTVLDGESKIELRPAEICVSRCYAEMTEDGIALDMVVSIVASGIEKDVSLFADEFGNLELLGEVKEEYEE